MKTKAQKAAEKKQREKEKKAAQAAKKKNQQPKEDEAKPEDNQNDNQEGKKSQMPLTNILKSYMMIENSYRDSVIQRSITNRECFLMAFGPFFLCRRTP